LNDFLAVFKEVLNFKKINPQDSTWLIQRVWVRATMHGMDIKEWIETMPEMFKNGQENGWAGAINTVVDRVGRDPLKVIEILKIGLALAENHGNKDITMQFMRAGQIRREVAALEAVRVAFSSLIGNCSDALSNLQDTLKAREFLSLDFSEEDAEDEMKEWSEKLFFVVLERTRQGESGLALTREQMKQVDESLAYIKRGIEAKVVDGYWNKAVESMNMSLQNKILKWEMENMESQPMIKNIQKAL
jgi:uncharacterized glyoxalase superfamily protein PhnB